MVSTVWYLTVLLSKKLWFKRMESQLVGSAVFRSLELNFKAFHADLEAIHGLDGSLCGGWVVETHESEAFALIRRPINEHFGTDDVSERKEHLHQLRVAKFLRQVVDEQVTAIRSLSLSQLVTM